MDDKISTFLMFSGQAEEAMNFYVSLMPDSRIDSIARYGAGQAGKEGSVIRATFTLGGRPYMAIDSTMTHPFGFTPAISLFVQCETASEIGVLFQKLSAGGQVLMPLDTYPFATRFGWVADKFGVSWQLSLT